MTNEEQQELAARREAVARREADAEAAAHDPHFEAGGTDAGVRGDHAPLDDATRGGGADAAGGDGGGTSTDDPIQAPEDRH